MIREFVKNNLPNLAILLPLLCVKLLLNNSLFLKQFVLIKEIIIANLGTLFFTNSLKQAIEISPQLVSETTKVGYNQHVEL